MLLIAPRPWRVDFRTPNFTQSVTSMKTTTENASRKTCHEMERPTKRTRRHSTAHIQRTSSAPDTGVARGAPCGDDASGDNMPPPPQRGGDGPAAQSVLSTPSTRSPIASSDILVLPKGCAVGAPAYRAKPAVPVTANRVQLFATAMVGHCELVQARLSSVWSTPLRGALCIVGCL